MSDEPHMEMTCTGAGGEWWLVLDLEDELRRSLEEFANDNIGEFGYGSEDGPGCDKHGGQLREEQLPAELKEGRSGCIDCLDEYRRVFAERAELWAKETAPVYATELERRDHVQVRLGREQITYRVRRRQ